MTTVNSIKAEKMKAVQAPIQTSMAFTYETWGVSVFRPEKWSKMSITDGATGGQKGLH